MHNPQNIMFPIKVTKISKEKLENLHFKCKFAHIRPISISKYINRLTIQKPNVKSKLPRTGYYGNLRSFHMEKYSNLLFGVHCKGLPKCQIPRNNDYITHILHKGHELCN